MVIWACVTVVLVVAAAVQGTLQPMGVLPDWALFGSSALEYVAQIFAVVPILATAYTCQMTVMFVVSIPPWLRADVQLCLCCPGFCQSAF